MNTRVIITVILSSLLLSADYQAKGDTCIDHNLKVSHIAGRVVATSSGREEPIPNATIELRQLRNDEWQTKFTVASDDKGFFQIRDVPSGKYDMHVTAQNFHSFATTVRLKASKSSATREIVVTLGIGFHDCGSASVRKLNAGRTSNNSLDRSGGSVFRIMTGPAMVE